MKPVILTHLNIRYMRTIVKDTTFFDSTTENPYWININFPQFMGRIYMSYKRIGKYTFQNLVNDAYNMTNKHTSRASGIIRFADGYTQRYSWRFF